MIGLNVALTHQNRSYRDSETNKTQRHRKGSREGETKGRGQRQLKINTTTKIEFNKQLIFVWYLAYNMSDMSGPTRNMKVFRRNICLHFIIFKFGPVNIDVFTVELGPLYY